MRRAFQRCAGSLLRGPSSVPKVSTPTNVRLDASSIGRRTATLSYASTRCLHQTSCLRQEAGVEEGTITKFAELGTKNIIHPNIVRQLTEGMRLETMTEVQSATLSEALSGTDLIAQAKTGTGKTIGFLLPILQNIIKIDPALADRHHGRRGPRTTADDIRALIISPTRELAEQIAEEARKVTAGTGIVVQTAVGGTQKREGMRKIQRDGCHILVGTPGRLKDILSDPYSRVEAPDLSALVFDEADRLLDQGFWPEIQEIMRLLPPPSEKERQTLMFSATIPQDVVALARSTLRKGFKFVRTIRDNEEPTHTRVPQYLVRVANLENALPALMELCNREAEAAKSDPSKPPFKAIVYFNSTADVNLTFSTLLNARPALGGAAVYQIHARLSQPQRTRAAELFRTCTSGIFLSSDVTARGMDFPGVTHVIQVGLPTSREMYIHRIGRTARAGREGTGYLLLPDMEAYEMRSRLGDLPLQRNDTIKSATIDLSQPSNDIPADTGRILSLYQQAIQVVPRVDKVKVFLALFGAFNWFSDKQRLVNSMNRLATYGWGLPEPPSIPPGLATKLNLTRGRIQGLRIGHDPDSDSARSDGSRPMAFGEQRGGPRGNFGRVAPTYGRSASFDRDQRGGFGGRRGNGDYGSYDKPRGSRAERQYDRAL